MDAFLRRVHEQREQQQREQDGRQEREAMAERSAKLGRRKLIAESAARHAEVFAAIRGKREREADELTSSMVDDEVGPVEERLRAEEEEP